MHNESVTLLSGNNAVEGGVARTNLIGRCSGVNARAHQLCTAWLLRRPGLARLGLGSSEVVRAEVPRRARSTQDV